MSGHPRHPHLTLLPLRLDFLRHTAEERLNSDAGVVAILHVPLPREVVKHHGPVHIQHLPTHHRIVQHVHGNVRGINVDKIEPSAPDPQLQQSVVALGFHHPKLANVVTFGHVGPETALQGRDVVLVGFVMFLVFHAAFEGVDARQRRLGVAHQVVQYPGRRRAFEGTNLQDLQLFAA